VKLGIESDIASGQSVTSFSQLSSELAGKLASVTVRPSEDGICALLAKRFVNYSSHAALIRERQLLLGRRGQLSSGDLFVFSLEITQKLTQAMTFLGFLLLRDITYRLVLDN